MQYMSWGMSIIPGSFPEFPVSYRFGDQNPGVAETAAPGLADPLLNDAGRSWSGNTQNITLVFTEAVTADATGWSITVNGVSKTLTYVSGSGTTEVVFQMNTVKHDADVVLISYDPATGSTQSVTGSVEIKKLVGVRIEGSLTRRVRFILCNSSDAVVSEAVKAAILEYHGGVVATESTYDPPSRWMTLANAATVTTDGSGQFDMEYTGVVRGGGTVYVAVIRATESLITTTTVV